LLNLRVILIGQSIFIKLFKSVDTNFGVMVMRQAMFFDALFDAGSIALGTEETFQIFVVNASIKEKGLR